MEPRHKKPKMRDILKKDDRSHDRGNHGHGNQVAQVHNHGTEPPKDVPIYTLAVILDDKVHEVLRAQEYLADVFLSTPKFILVTDETGQAKIGMNYSDGKFTE